LRFSKIAPWAFFIFILSCNILDLVYDIDVLGGSLVDYIPLSAVTLARRGSDTLILSVGADSLNLNLEPFQNIFVMLLKS